MRSGFRLRLLGAFAVESEPPVPVPVGKARRALAVLALRRGEFVPVDRLVDALGGHADLVLSDMAANTVAHPQTDHLRTMGLVEAGAGFAGEVLRPGGAFVAKVLAGGADSNLVAELKRMFATVKHAKPPASRKDSSEWYVIAQGFKGTT